MELSDKPVVSRLVVLSLEEFGAVLVVVSDVGAVMESITTVEYSVNVSIRSTLVVTLIAMVEFGSSSKVTELLASVDVSITSMVVSVAVPVLMVVVVSVPVPEAVDVVSLAVVVVVSSRVVIVVASFLVVAILVSSAVLVAS